MFVHIDNKKKDVIILGKSPADGLNDTSVTAEKDYLMNFNKQQTKLGLGFNVEIYKIETKTLKNQTYFYFVWLTSQTFFKLKM